MSGRPPRSGENAGVQEAEKDGTGPQYPETSDREQRILEKAGWELVEETLQIKLWRNPESGRLYPQKAATKLIREGLVPQSPDGS